MYEFTDLKPYTPYSFTILGYNLKGTGEFSPPVVTWTDEQGREHADKKTFGVF